MNFRGIKFQATVETATILLTEGQIDDALEKFCDTLKRLGLAILSVEPKEAPPVRVHESLQSLEYSD